MTVDEKMLEFVAGQKWGVLATIRRNGRPQLSNVGYAYDPEQRHARGGPLQGAHCITPGSA